MQFQLILNHIKPSLRKEPDQILIHAGTNDLANIENYLKNVKKNVKLVRETCKNTKICFSPLICRADVADINKKVIQTNKNLEKPKVLKNRSYKVFYEDRFLYDLEHGLSNNGNFTDFTD